MDQTRALDVRIPLGGLFTIVGLLLAGYGLVTGRSTALYVRSLGINVNLWWGLVMLVFGVGLLVLARRGSRGARHSRARGNPLRPDLPEHGPPPSRG